MNLDDAQATLTALNHLSKAGANAYKIASEDDERSGDVRSMLYGINTTIDALISIIEDRYPSVTDEP